MEVSLLNDSLHVKVFYEESGSGFNDNICVSFLEHCPEAEKIFKAGETNIFLTAKQARRLALALFGAAECSNCSEGE